MGTHFEIIYTVDHTEIAFYRMVPISFWLTVKVSWWFSKNIMRQ